MAKWEFKWYNTDTHFWVPLVAEIDQIRQELAGDWVATFWLANTAAHLTVIQADLQIKIWFDNKLQFSGTLCCGDLGAKRIKAVCYERVPLILDQFNTYTHVWDLTPANTIIADV